MLSLVATSLIYELGYALRGPRSDGLIGSLKMRPTVHMIAIPLCYETRSSAMDRFFDAQQRTGAWESLCAPSLRTLSSVQRQIHTWEHGYALAGPCSFDAYLVSPRLYDTPADSRVGARTKHTQIGRRQESAVRAKKCLGTIESATTATSAISMERNSTGALSANDGASKTISKNSLSYQGGQAFRFAARSRACSTLLQSVAGARRSFLCLRSGKPGAILQCDRGGAFHTAEPEGASAARRSTESDSHNPPGERGKGRPAYAGAPSSLFMSRPTSLSSDTTTGRMTAHVPVALVRTKHLSTAHCLVPARTDLDQFVGGNSFRVRAATVHTNQALSGWDWPALPACARLSCHLASLHHLGRASSTLYTTAAALEFRRRNATLLSRYCTTLGRCTSCSPRRSRCGEDGDEACRSMILPFPGWATEGKREMRRGQGSELCRTSPRCGVLRWT